MEQNMYRIMFIAVVFMTGLSTLTVKTVGQTDRIGLVSAPEWKAYSLTPNEIGVSFPKFPVADYLDRSCEYYEQFSYAAFADDVVYTAVVSRQKTKNRSQYCKKAPKFGRETMENRIKELARLRNMEIVARSQTQDPKKTHLRSQTYHILVVDDLENKRFVELWITAHENRAVDESAFFDSLKFNPESSAISVRGGVANVVGDDVQRTTDAKYWKNGKPEQMDTSLTLVHKPKPGYTDLARKRGQQGTVVLRATFSSNGSVSNVDIVGGLQYGLTERAIAAARRIVFLPRKDNGVNKSVIRTIEYSFTMY